jgi:hypothetical protein
MTTNDPTAATPPQATLALLDRAGFGRLEGSRGCVALSDPKLLKQLLDMAGTATRQDPATVRAGTGQLLTQVAPLLGSPPALELLRVPAGKRRVGEELIVSFRLLEASYCFLSTVLVVSDDGILLSWPDRVILRMRRLTARLPPAGKAQGILTWPGGRLAGRVLNVCEGGACLAFPETAAAILPGGPVEAAIPDDEIQGPARVRWSAAWQDRTLVGIELQSLSPSVRRRSKERRLRPRLRLFPPEPCILVLSDGTRLAGTVCDLSESGAAVRLKGGGANARYDRQSPLNMVALTGDHPAGRRLPVQSTRFDCRSSRSCLEGLEDNGTIARLEVSLGGGAVHLPARVCRVEGEAEGRLLGVHFAPMPVRAREQILSYLLPRVRPTVRPR